MLLAVASSGRESGLLSAGDFIAIAVAILTIVTTVGVTLLVQRGEDRRAGRKEAWARDVARVQRVHAEFHRVLHAAHVFESMTDPWRWTPDQQLPDDERQRLHDTLGDIFRGLGDAIVHLTLEQVDEPVRLVLELDKHFGTFRRGLLRLGEGKDIDYAAMQEATGQIRAIRERLGRELPGILIESRPPAR